MKPIRVSIDCREEAVRINSMKKFKYPVKVGDIYECIMRGGISLAGDGRIALRSPFDGNALLCAGDIVVFDENDENKPENGIIVIDFFSSRTIAQMYNFGDLKTVRIVISDYYNHQDKRGIFTRIRSAFLIPNPEEIKIKEPRTLDRKLQPSVMLN